VSAPREVTAQRRSGRRASASSASTPTTAPWARRGPSGHHLSCGVGGSGTSRRPL